MLKVFSGTYLVHDCVESKCSFLLTHLMLFYDTVCLEMLNIVSLVYEVLHFVISIIRVSY